MDVSVVINTRDRPQRLRTVLSALRRQVDVPGGLEVVVVDDGSTADLAPALTGHEPLPITLIRQPRLGYTAARNAGLRAAGGAVVLCLDDDVVFDEHLVATHMEVHREDPSAVVVGDRYNTFRANLDSPESRAMIDAAVDGDLRPLRRWSRRDYYARQTFKLFDRDPRGRPAPWLCFVTRNVSFRARDAAAVGGFDEGFVRWGVDDIDIGLRMYRAGVRYHYRPAARVFHLETPLSPDKLDALRASLDYFSEKYSGPEPVVFREFVFGRMALEELCASIVAGHPVTFAQRDGLTFFHTRR